MSEHDFQRFVRELDGEIDMHSPRGFDLVYEEPGFLTRVNLAPDDLTLMCDVYVHDVARFQGGVRRALVRALLTINDSAVRHSSFSVGIDNRSYLVLSGRLPLFGETANQHLTAEIFYAHLDFWLEQATKLRDCARAMAFEGAGFQFTLAPAN